MRLTDFAFRFMLSGAMVKQSELIEVLKAEHRCILADLESANQLGIATFQGREKVVQAREVLMTHLAREDHDLYPFLRHVAQKDEQLDERLDVFVGGLEAITELARDFFEKYTEEKLTDDGDIKTHVELYADFGRFFTFLKRRIDEEEQVLYAAYLRHW